MSLLPSVFGYDPFETRMRRRMLDWDHFGLGISPEEILSMVEVPERRLRSRLQSTGTELQLPAVGKDGFQTSIDVQQFKPSEITVKTVDNHVVVEGKHEERQDDHGYISRQFVRRYALPKGYDANEVTSTLSSDGVLTIKAPPPQKSIQGNERSVQIQQTGPAHMNVKDNAIEEKNDKNYVDKK